MTKDADMDDELAEFLRDMENAKREWRAYLDDYARRRRKNQAARAICGLSNLGALVYNVNAGNYASVPVSALAVAACILIWPSLPKDPRDLIDRPPRSVLLWRRGARFAGRIRDRLRRASR